jgi:hypothetical protein
MVIDVMALWLPTTLEPGGNDRLIFWLDANGRIASTSARSVFERPFWGFVDMEAGE